MASDWGRAPSAIPLSQLETIAPPGSAGVSATALFAALTLIGGATTVAPGLSVSSLRLSPQGIDGLHIALEAQCEFSLVRAMGEIKRRTAASWDDLAKIFGVSRQSVHSWARGGQIKPAHLEKVRTVLDRLQQLSNLRPFQIRNQLFADAGVVLETRLHASHEPPILAADHTPLTKRLQVVSAGKTKILQH